jgi:hypothetical protein
MTRRDDSKIIRIVHPICCGLDVHKESVSACVIFPDSNGGRIIRGQGIRHIHGRFDETTGVVTGA